MSDAIRDIQAERDFQVVKDFIIQIRKLREIHSISKARKLDVYVVPVNTGTGREIDILFQERKLIEHIANVRILK
jgi:valyl-tRNA synthetase